jgi:hypothetical protein
VISKAARTLLAEIRRARAALSAAQPQQVR